jgi:hypothetical protein
MSKQKAKQTEKEMKAAAYAGKQLGHIKKTGEDLGPWFFGGFCLFLFCTGD